MKFSAIFLAVIVSATEHKDTYGHTDYGDQHLADEVLIKHGKDMNIDYGQLALDTGNEKYYWFALHDHNSDEHLDGHELFGSLRDQTDKVNEVEYASWVDYILEHDDLDGE